MTNLFAYLGCAVLAGLTIFQTALILGAPIGRFAWGGAHRVLPAKLRVASVSSILIYVVFAVFLLERAGLIRVIGHDGMVRGGMWVMTAYFFLGIFMNAISRSRPERLVMVPTAAVLAFVFLMVAIA